MIENTDEKYCDWCGSELKDDGHCPNDDCVHNLLLELEAE